MSYRLQSINLTKLANDIHADNIVAGWWRRDEGGAVVPRNIGELLALVHSEISEADEDGQDDKLPHRRAFEVELADVAIRVLDILGFYEFDVQRAFASCPTDTPTYRLRAIWTNEMHKETSRALEHFRKGRELEGCESLVTLLAWCDFAAVVFNLDVVGAIEEKRAYNAKRADHKPENRAADGGKKF